MYSKIETKNTRKWGITDIHGKKSGWRRPPRSGSDEEPMNPEHRRALRGDVGSNRQLRKEKRMGTKGKRENPFGPRP
jgi:hypothetical protein